jgi:hypothetical protein
LTPGERRIVVGIPDSYLSDKSSIVKTFAMQALADLAMLDVELRQEVIEKIEALTANGTPAMRSRGKKLLKMLKEE